MKNITRLQERLDLYLKNHITILQDTNCWIPKIAIKTFRIDNELISLSRAIFLVYKPEQILLFSPLEIGRTCKNSHCYNPEHLYYKSIYHRFWEKVNKKDKNDCWEWNASTDAGGYGVFTLGKGVQEKAHRYSWFLANGPIPSGLWVLHTCDNPPCVNPAHLFLGNNADNVKDKQSKDRCSRLFGEANNSSKLSKVSVLEIISLHKNGISYRKLAKQYRISVAQIGRIIRKESWKWIWD